MGGGSGMAFSGEVLEGGRPDISDMMAAVV